MQTALRSKLLVAALVVWMAVLLGLPCGCPRAQGGVEPRLSTAGALAAAATPAIGLTYHWHTFYGVVDPLDQLELRGVAVDAAGNVYVAGCTPQTWGTPLHAYHGDRDVVIIKLNSLGVYQWHTFYGAAATSAEDGDDEAAGIAVDALGNIYVTGYSDRTWQGPGNIAPLSPHGGGNESMFALKLDDDGAYQWHTFFQPGRANAIAVDSLGGVVVTGYATWQVGGPEHTGDGTGQLTVWKLSTQGAYQWHTYYGAGAGAGDEAGYGVATDAQGSVYVTGTASSTWLGDGNAAPLNAFSGGAPYTDMVVLKLDGSGAYQWHTFAGANGQDDAGSGIAWGGGGTYVTGRSPATWGSPRHVHSGEADIVVLKLNGSGQRQWHTFYGSDANDFGTSVAVDAAGTTYVTGWSAWSWAGDGGASPTHPFSGAGQADIVVLKLDSSGAYQRHTFYGASETDDYGASVALSTDYGVYATGTSVATWQGDGSTSPIRAHSGNATGDGFVLKLSDRVHNVYLPLTVSKR